MTPKEKAEELFSKCLWSQRHFNGLASSKVAKECALIAVDEIIKSSPSLPILSDKGTFVGDIEESLLYWQEVKQEIEML